MKSVHVIDSHTAGEPTRVVVDGGPDLGCGPLENQLAAFRTGFDQFRSAVINEPRGSDVLVGALLCRPADPASAAGVIFFNNRGYLGMCGHGTIGLVASLRYLQRLDLGTHRIETAVGAVSSQLLPDGRVSVRNVTSFRLRKEVTVDVDGYGKVTGEIAWGGNWFFLVKEFREELSLRRAAWLSELTRRIREALCRAGIKGLHGAEIDHIELFGPPRSGRADSRNFVMCPGGAYDRSPCGTGTSAKLACLAADGLLLPGQVWRQESILGTIFEGSYEPAAASDLVEGSLELQVTPTITGRAWITGDSRLLFDESDPFAAGIRE